jgi:hypothetical protein
MLMQKLIQELLFGKSVFQTQSRDVVFKPSMVKTDNEALNN